ncbi:hypothetical protein V8C37DRAFT_379246 [Trichoderma ceciliae]
MAVADAAPATPSPPSSIRTPPAPRLGYHDSWEPYSPRKSARLSAQRASARTPSPPPAARQAIASPRTAAKSAAQSSSAMASPVASPRKKRQPAADSVRRVSAALTVEASAASGSKDKSAVTRSVASSSLMLPTPSKTPQKPPSSKTTTQIQSFARNLFPPEETDVSSPRKKRAKKYSGMTLESFRAEVAEEDIEIFTDSQDRVPKKDDSKSNPFLGNATNPEPSKRRTKRKVLIPGEGAQSVDEASRREDGMIYVFRGKKFFRKFSEFDDDEEDEELSSDVEAHFSRPLTRSSIKPRLLFPSKTPAPKTKRMLEEEEAATDVEDAAEAEKPSANAETPMKAQEERAQTPEAPKFAPASPPETRRTTRSTNKLSSDSAPIKRTGKKSPFDSWLRTKEHANRSGTKRAAEQPLAPTHAKRTRS